MDRDTQLSAETMTSMLLSIGALSRATGVPVETIRTWERRYGFPVPTRRKSGHRRYPITTVERLRLVHRAVSAGHRPSAVVCAPAEDLRQLLLTTARPLGGGQGTRPAAAADRSRVVGEWLSATARLDGEGLDRLLWQSWTAVSVLEFLDQRVCPYLCAVGDAWQCGELQVMHEHFASERVRDFLTSQWRRLTPRSEARRVVVATLGGERHHLSIHMAALVLAIVGVAPAFLGSDTPVQDVAAAAHQCGAVAVVIGSSSSTPADQFARQLEQLRDGLHDGVQLAFGGTSLAECPQGASRLASFAALERWARAL